jgi:hypothetical protein
MIKLQQLQRPQYIQIPQVNTVMVDYHVHDFRSRDASNATIDQYVEQAEIRGINEIIFTTHLIVDGPDAARE